jgi:hypothetical protein
MGMRYEKSLGSKHYITISLLVVLITVSTVSGVLGQNPSQAQKAVPAQQTYAKNLVVLLTLYGINSTTGDIFAFVKAHNMIKSTLINATKLDAMDNNTDGIGQTGLTFANLKLNPGEPYATCVVILKDVKMVCSTDYKTPFPRAQYVDISIQ